MADAHKNFAYSAVATAPSPATSGTSLVVTAGAGALFPTPPFNATIWPAGGQPLSTNAEIVRVTAISTDTFTITRAQESSSARTVIVGDQIAATITKATFDDYLPLSGGTLTGTLTSQTITPVTTGTYTLGDSLHYFLSADITTLNLNSTASLSGGTAGVANFNGDAINIVGSTVNTGFQISSNNSTGTSIQLNNSTSGAHNYQFFVTGSGNNPGQFGVYDASSRNTPLSVYGGSNPAGAGSWIIIGSSGEIGWSSSTTATLFPPDTYMTRASAGVIGTPSLSIATGNKLLVGTGTNASAGTAVLVAGTVTVSTTAVTASSIIFLTCQVLGTVTVASALSIGTVTAGSSFVIKSAVVTDTSTIGWWIIN
jgi:hypothetical protein